MRPAASIASRASRIPPSPVACVWVWNPSLSWPVGVVVEHPGGVRLDHVVGVQLHRPEPQQVARGRAVDGLPQLAPEGGVGVDRVEQRCDDARREQPGIARPVEEAQLGERHLRLDDGGDAARGGEREAAEQLAVTALRRVHRNVALEPCQTRGRHRAGVEVGDPAGRLPVLVPLRPTPRDVASRGDAEGPEGGVVEPDRVLVVGGDEHRAVGEAGEVGSVRPAPCDHRVDRVLGADPVEVGPAVGEVADAPAHLLERLRTLQADRVRVEAEQEVAVAVDDAGGDQCAAEVARLAGRWGVGGGADVADPAVGHADRLGPGAGVVERADAGPGEEEVGVLRCGHGGSHRR